MICSFWGQTTVLCVYFLKIIFNTALQKLHLFFLLTIDAFVCFLSVIRGSGRVLYGRDENVSDYSMTLSVKKLIRDEFKFQRIFALRCRNLLKMPATAIASPVKLSNSGPSSPLKLPSVSSAVVEGSPAKKLRFSDKLQVKIILLDTNCDRDSVGATSSI
jgi:hypothetical protein